MRIKVLLNLGADLPKFRQDEIREVSDELGLMLVAQHLAVELPPEPVEATPPDPAPLATPDKFQAMRQHPDHLTKKPAARHRKHKPETNSEGD